MNQANRIGEIIETGTTLFVAESFALNQPPPLGRLVYVQNGDIQIYGVVCFGTTTSPDPGRRAVRRSTVGVYDEAIYHEHPQLEHTLHTEFTVRLVGYSQNGIIYRYLPPTPPPLHFSVLDCHVNQVHVFTEQLTYLRLLLQAVEIPPEQLIAAHIRQAYQARGHDDSWLTGAARLIAGLFKNDYDRLMTVLNGIVPQEGS